MTAVGKLARTTTFQLVMLAFLVTIVSGCNNDEEQGQDCRSAYNAAMLEWSELMTSIDSLPENHPWPTVGGLVPKFREEGARRVTELQERHNDIMFNWNDMVGWSEQQVEDFVAVQSDYQERAIVLGELATLVVDSTRYYDDRESVESIAVDARRVIDVLQTGNCISMTNKDDRAR